MRRKKLRTNPTVVKMAMGLMKFRRRVEIPCWHIDHLRKIVSILREYADRLEAIADANKLRPSDKTSAAQQIILQMNSDMNRMTPTDPRERGAERGGYNHEYGRGYLDTNGFDELLARDDMND